MMKSLITSFFLSALLFGCANETHEWSQVQYLEISSETLNDKIRGGLLGQILGNLNGLEHEMQYISEPGNVSDYIPSLPDGAWTDDDTDFEWVYIKTMLDEDTVFIPNTRIAELWKERINRRIWCSNLYVRQLMDIGMIPPLTGMVAFNPWAEFNISGQFLCETFGLIAPGMPREASKIGLHYTRVGIDGEPAQTTQLFNSMIATAFFTNDIHEIIQAGVDATDESSVLREIVDDELKWFEKYPDDWRKTRTLTKETYTRFDGAMRDKNGYELNTASIIAALLYGRGDVAETLTIAFNFGWDADCNAATAGTIVGVMKGYRWMLSQGWKIVDRYKNTTRENMPDDETITSFADRIMVLAEKTIINRGGERLIINGKPTYKIAAQKPGNIYGLQSVKEQSTTLASGMIKDLEKSLLNDNSGIEEKALTAYYSICLGLDGDFESRYTAEWNSALEALSSYKNILQVVYHHSDVPLGYSMQKKFTSAGIYKPEAREELWK